MLCVGCHSAFVVFVSTMCGHHTKSTAFHTSGTRKCRDSKNPHNVTSRQYYVCVSSLALISPVLRTYQFLLSFTTPAFTPPANPTHTRIVHSPAALVPGCLCSTPCVQRLAAFFPDGGFFGSWLCLVPILRIFSPAPRRSYWLTFLCSWVSAPPRNRYPQGRRTGGTKRWTSPRKKRGLLSRIQTFVPQFPVIVTQYTILSAS